MGGLSNLATLGLNIALQQQAQKRRAARISREAQAQRQELVARLAEQQRRTDELLREQLARARARAGAAGVANGASFDAILRGLEQQADASKSAAQAEFAADLNRLRERLTLARRRNLLEAGDRLFDSFADGLRRFPAFRRDLLG